MARGVWLICLACCSLLWTLAHSQLTPDSDVPSVRVTVSVSEHFVTLSCDVTGTRAGADDHKVQFFCPVLPDDVQCFGDCSPICTMHTDGSCRVMDPILDSGDSIACQKVVSASREAKSVRLRIDTRQARLAGQWRCKFRGTSSATVSLAQAPTPVADGARRSSPAANASAATAEGFTKAPHQAKATASSSDQFGLGVWKPDARKYPSDFAPTQDFERHPNLARFARTDYVIGVLTIMSVSLLLNLGFCIRCILARHYVETRKRHQLKPLGWLGSCLCVSTVQVTLDASDADRDEAGAAASDGGAAGRLRQQRRSLPGDGRGLGGGEGSRQQLQRQRLQQQQQQQLLQQQPCLYCMQADCRILYDDVARSSSECGSSCRGGNGCGGGSFRLASAYEGHVTRGSLLAVPAVPEEAAAAAAAAAAEAEAEAVEHQVDSGSDVSGSDPSCRLELSRRMLRKADTLLREANSLLLETESTTEQQPEQ